MFIFILIYSLSMLILTDFFFRQIFCILSFRACLLFASIWSKFFYRIILNVFLFRFFNLRFFNFRFFYLWRFFDFRFFNFRFFDRFSGFGYNFCFLFDRLCFCTNSVNRNISCFTTSCIYISTKLIHNLTS